MPQYPFDPNILARIAEIEQSNPYGTITEPPDFDIQDYLRQNPLQHTASDRLNAMLNQLPVRGTPSKSQNILGAVAGLGEGVRPAQWWGGQPVGIDVGPTRNALEAQELIRFRPFYQQMQD